MRARFASCWVQAFRTLHAKMTEGMPRLVRELLPAELYGAEVELGPYLLDSFGNPIRIDYGTGHELHFCIFLYCLNRLGLLTQADFTAAVVRVFHQYLQLCRKMQRTYGMEPAGSRGVWALDDHQFLPFIFGAGQLVGSKEYTPNAVLDERLMAEQAEHNLYFSCIHYIYSTERGPFFEHSPDLYQISGVPSWEKINLGLIRKYEDDVLSKWPVLQHVLFGKLFAFE